MYAKRFRPSRHISLPQDIWWDMRRASEKLRFTLFFSKIYYHEGWEKNFSEEDKLTAPLKHLKLS